MSSILKYLGLYPKSLPFSLDPVEVEEIEQAAERRPRTLKHFIKANHANFGLVFNDKTPNQLSYNLGCAYFLGASWEQLNQIYEMEELKLTNAHYQWKDAPSEVNPEDWTYFLGKPEYQRAYVDFFEDQLVQFAYDWRALVHHHLYIAEFPLICNLMGGEGDPLIQLAFALEVSSKTMAIESLARACCEYDPVFAQCCSHQNSDANSHQNKESFESILDLISKDEELSNQKYKSVEEVLENQGSRLSSYAQKWSIDGSSLESEFTKALLTVVAFATETNTNAKIFQNVIKTSYGLRTLLPLQKDAESQICLVRQWLLLIISTYVFAKTPSAQTIGKQETIEDLSWRDIQNSVLNIVSKGDISLNPIGIIRSLKAMAEAFPSQDAHFVKAASRYVCMPEYESQSIIDSILA